MTHSTTASSSSPPPAEPRFAGPARTHIAFAVAELPRAVAFYEALFNLAPSKVKADYAKFEPAWPSLNLALNLSGAANSPASRLHHFGIELPTPAAVEAEAQRLRARGLKIEDEANTTCCYARQDKFWVRDPDGHAWEVFTVLEAADDAPNRDPDGTCCTEEACACTAENCC